MGCRASDEAPAEEWPPTACVAGERKERGVVTAVALHGSVSLRDRRGQAVPLVLVAVVMAVLLTVAMGSLGRLAVEASRARTAADAAALAGVEGGQAAAARLAAAHDATLTSYAAAGPPDAAGGHRHRSLRPRHGDRVREQPRPVMTAPFGPCPDPADAPAYTRCRGRWRPSRRRVRCHRPRSKP